MSGKPRENMTRAHTISLTAHRITSSADARLVLPLLSTYFYRLRFYVLTLHHAPLHSETLITVELDISSRPLSYINIYY
jgi:hypothetical protein